MVFPNVSLFLLEPLNDCIHAEQRSSLCFHLYFIKPLCHILSSSLASLTFLQIIQRKMPPAIMIRPLTRQYPAIGMFCCPRRSADSAKTNKSRSNAPKTEEVIPKILPDIRISRSISSCVRFLFIVILSFLYDFCTARGTEVTNLSAPAAGTDGFTMFIWDAPCDPFRMECGIIP